MEAPSGELVGQAVTIREWTYEDGRKVRCWAHTSLFRVCLGGLGDDGPGVEWTYDEVRFWFLFYTITIKLGCWVCVGGPQGAVPPPYSVMLFGCALTSVG